MDRLCRPVRTPEPQPSRVVQETLALEGARVLTPSETPSGLQAGARV